MSESNIESLIVIGPRDKVPEGYTVINTTSKDNSDLGKKFSPFLLNNIPIYDNKIAKNLENAWQFSKVYKEYVDDNGDPTDKYFIWANKGWSDTYAQRYPKGKGAIPLYSYWKTIDKDTGKIVSHKWGYIEARKKIYFPLYAKSIINTKAFKEVKNRLDNGERIALWDFDGYDHKNRGMSYEDVVNSEKYKCGHAFVVYGLLTNKLKLINDELIFDFNNNLENLPLSISPISNSYPSRFIFKNVTFISNEQWIAFCKAKNFNDNESADNILNIKNQFVKDNTYKTEMDKICFDLIQNFEIGKLNTEDILHNKEYATAWNIINNKIMKLGENIANYQEDKWILKRKDITMFGARQKFIQNEILKKDLFKNNFSNSDFDSEILNQLKKEFERSNNKSEIEVVNFYQVGKVIPENGVYIGRANKSLNLEGSKFANPFPMKDKTEEERIRVISEYKKWIWQKVLDKQITKEDLFNLKRKKLVCYCAPKSCHGDVVKALVEYVMNNEAEFDAKVQDYQNKSKMKP